jgi:hypothetical protein
MGRSRDIRLRQLGPRQRMLATLIAEQFGVSASYWLRRYGLKLPPEDSIDEGLLKMDREAFSRWAADVMQREVFQENARHPVLGSNNVDTTTN